MPKLRLDQAAQAKIPHCEINIGYNKKKGGLGRVTAMIIEQAMLANQAVSSNRNLAGQALKSALIHRNMSTTALET